MKRAIGTETKHLPRALLRRLGSFGAHRATDGPGMRWPWMRRALSALAGAALLSSTVAVVFAPAASASPSGSLDQCSNGTTFPVPSTQCSATDASNWINGDLNSSKSSYREGDTVPFRATMGGFTALTSHDVVITYQTTKSGKHAYDYLTSVGNTVVGADACAGNLACAGPPTLFPIPADPHVTGAGVTPLPSVFSCYQCLVTAVSSYSLSGLYSGDSQTSVDVTFTALASSVVLAWGGHVASPLNWGPGAGAGSIPGSPYHMMLSSVDGGSVGAQDRAMAASALAPSPAIVTTASPSLATVNHTVTDSATITGTSTNGHPSGTVTFFVCGPAGSAPDCSTIGSGSQVGSPVTVTTSGTDSGSATSPAYTPTSSGWFCFRAEYQPDVNANYSPATETNQTSECFFAQDVGLNIAKTADNGTVNAGDPIGYTISVTNSGSTDATSVVVTDTVPTNSGTSWTVTSVVLGGNAQSGSWIASNCAISSGKLTCHLGTVPANTTSGSAYTIHLSSPTTSATCGNVSNSASAADAANNSASTPAPAVITVGCPALAITKTADKGTVNGGDPIGFTISVTNSGSGDAKGATVTDTLPATSGTNWSVDVVDLAGNAQSSSWIASNCAISNGSLSCDLGTVPAHTTSGYTVHLTSPTTKASCGSVSNSATVTPSNGASASTAAPAVVTVNCLPALSATKASTPVSGSSVSPGQTVTYDITLANAGIAPASAVVVTDSVPAGLSYVSGSASCGAVPTCVVTVANGVITWTGVVVPSATGQTPGSVVLSFEATVNNGVTNGQVIPNTASFTNMNTASCTGSTCPTNTVTLNAVVPATTPSSPPPPPPTAPASQPAAKALPIVAATEVHTGKPWAGARPFELIVAAFGALLVGSGLLRRRRRGLARAMANGDGD